MDFMTYIEPELYITVPTLYVLGLMIKKSAINDKYIPLILGAMGIVLATAYKITAYVPTDFVQFMKILFAGVTQGILCAAGSVYANNIVQQLKEDENSDKGDQSGNKGNF